MPSWMPPTMSITCLSPRLTGAFPALLSSAVIFAVAHKQFGLRCPISGK